MSEPIRPTTSKLSSRAALALAVVFGCNAETMLVRVEDPRRAEPAQDGGAAPAQDGDAGGSSGDARADGGGLEPESTLPRPPGPDGCQDVDHAFSLPIEVNDVGNSVLRVPALTSFLVPVRREEGLRSLDGLVVLDERGARLPAQFEVLSRWGGAPQDCARPIRFAYAHVRATPPTGGRARWSVKQVRDSAPISLTLKETNDALMIDTGVARFTLDRTRFRGLTKVQLREAGGLRTVSELAPGESSFVMLRDGELSSGAGTTWRLEFERRGPELATVVARGFYGRAGRARDLGFTVRLTFIAGSGDVRVEHTYYHGATGGWGATDVANTARVERVFMRVPLSETPSSLAARALDTLHPLAAQEAVQLEQEKRTPDAPTQRFRLVAGGRSVERGTLARRPLLAAKLGEARVMATLARIAVREPQGLRWDPAARAIELDFTSGPLQIGGARGIWGVAVLSFEAQGAITAARADALLQYSERPLLGVPELEYLASTQTLGPYAASATPLTTPYFTLMRDIHQRTVRYLEDYKITGIQLWPDLPRASCYSNYDCAAAAGRLHEGGDDNYWNWSKVGIDEFFRTGDNSYLYDFSLGEAVTYAETLAVRTDHDRIGDSSVMGLAPCYGDSRGYGGNYVEGLNHRRDRCPADYAYNKTLKHAYLATADARFVDFFEEAGLSVVNSFGNPSVRAEPFLELDFHRLSEQRLENLASGAEFSREPAVSAVLLTKLREYTDFMLGRTLIDGHVCDVGGSGSNDAKALGSCRGGFGWMMPTPVEWAIRTARILEHRELFRWLSLHAQVSMRRHTVLDASGRPDYSRLRASSGDDAQNGWRTTYRCATDARGVVEATCAKQTGGENSYYFYANGLVAYLNVFGLLLAQDPSDPNGLCRWLPEVYQRHLASLDDGSMNHRIWGKESGQAFAFSAEAVGAMSRCR